ncbi:hypothetical protein A3770_11p63610 [Chloropicon primus]|uniref:Uncharacterized protein n=1 Tax=Chloropicon primus TaxID=1764295 RepID=A0A5B8MTF7_9CHLO|nr:hypothetical protein A3770_11p63610 [Chloropicon primus]|eukprot:QDZ23843.1 hypothetical protein A3770_11p63610 [Chloropicon primus]
MLQQQYHEVGVPPHHHQVVGAEAGASGYHRQESRSSSSHSQEGLPPHPPPPHPGAGGPATEAVFNALGYGGPPAQSAKKPPSSKYGFRFLKHERQILEQWYADHDGRTAPIAQRKQWCMVWNDHRKRYKEYHTEVTHQQCKQWFENMRRTRNQKGGGGRVKHHHHHHHHMAGGPPGHFAPHGQPASVHPGVNPRTYLAASTAKMHDAITQAAATVAEHMHLLQEGYVPPEDDAEFGWEEADLKGIVEKLLVALESQFHSNSGVPSPQSTISPQQEFHFRIFQQMLAQDRQMDGEWENLNDLSAMLQERTEGDEDSREFALENAGKIVDMYLQKLEMVVTEKTKIIISLLGSLPVLIQPPASVKSEAAAVSDPDGQRDLAWSRAWTAPPRGLDHKKTATTKLDIFQGCFLSDHQRANYFLGVPLHASALASAVCFSLGSGSGDQEERLTSQQADNLVSLYEVAAVQELELTQQLDSLWNLKPFDCQSLATDSWRMWIQNHNKPEFYYPLKVLADAVPAADQNYGFVSATRNSLVLSLSFLKGLRYALPLPLFIKCMIQFHQAHYLFSASAMLEELTVMAGNLAGSAGPKDAKQDASQPSDAHPAVKEEKKEPAMKQEEKELVVKQEEKEPAVKQEEKEPAVMQEEKEPAVKLESKTTTEGEEGDAVKPQGV